MQTFSKKNAKKIKKNSGNSAIRTTTHEYNTELNGLLASKQFSDLGLLFLYIMEDNALIGAYDQIRSVADL